MRFGVKNPFNSQLVSLVAETSNIENVIESAYKAQWKPKDELSRLFQLIEREKNQLAKTISLESGKPISQALAEVDYANSFIKWFSHQKIYGKILPSNTDNEMFVTKEPVGLACLITPFNFPLAMITRKLAPALAAGCTVLLKPAPETPLTCLALLDLVYEAGVPKDVVQPIICSLENTPKVGSIITSSPLIRKISFTGSTAVGKLLLAQSSSTLKRISLELGGNAPFIVFEDAELDAAVQGLINAKFRYSGQTCVCPNRVYVHSNIHDKFVELLKAKVLELKMGDPLDASTMVGPLIHERSLEKVKSHVNDAIEKGATLECGGKHENLIYHPTILTNVNESMKIFQEETFGPVAGIQKFDSYDEIIKIANGTPYGLAAYFFSSNAKTIFKAGKDLKAGMIGANTGLISSTVAPFGGIKESGLGREGSCYGIDEYLDIKYMCLKP